MPNTFSSSVSLVFLFLGVPLFFCVFGSIFFYFKIPVFFNNSPVTCDNITIESTQHQLMSNVGIRLEISRFLTTWWKYYLCALVESNHKFNLVNIKIFTYEENRLIWDFSEMYYYNIF